MTIQVFEGAFNALVASLFTLFLASACANAEDDSARFDASDLDTSVRPGDDFDAYASGGWRRRVEIPADQESVGTIDGIEDRTQTCVRQLIETSGGDTKQGALVGELYAAFMNEAEVERRGDAPLRRDLSALDAITDKTTLAQFMGGTQTRFGRSFFSANIWVDLKDPTSNVLRIDQSGLGMRVREAYFGDGAQTALAAYADYIARSLTLIGRDDAKRIAGEILALETKIADASWSVADNGDRDKRYNPMTVSELESFAPGFPWRAYLRGLGAAHVERVIALQKSAFPQIAAIFARTPLETLKAWEAFHIVDTASRYLPQRFADNAFGFRDRVERGIEQKEPRWKGAVAIVNEVLTDAVGYLYVAKYFQPEVKARVEAMASNFKAAFRNRIEHLTWMSPATKAAALIKLDRVRYMIGHPARWRDYSSLTLDRSDLYDSVQRARAFEWAAEVATLSEPVDPEHWYLPPQEVDAFSDQSRVAIGITAGILQAPLFDPNGDEALNYGGIGEALGHELTHQFDDQGRKFDMTGMRRDWWPPEDAAKFQAAAAKLIAQFDGFEILPGVHLKGAQTLSEDIADLGGLLLALDAYHLSLKGTPAPVVDGLTGDQRLFLAWARVFRTKTREASLRRQALEGSHTPFKFRALAPMRNVDGWYDAFGVKPGEKYYLSPADRVRIW